MEETCKSGDDFLPDFWRTDNAGGLDQLLFVPFVACRAATGAFTMVAMIVMVDGLGIRQDFICKIVVSAISLVLNYIFSKWFIFRKKES